MSNSPKMGHLPIPDKTIAIINGLDDGKILTGKPDLFDGIKPMGFRLRFSQLNQSNGIKSQNFQGLRLGPCLKPRTS